MNIDPKQFLAVVRSPLEAGNAEELAEAVLGRWKPKQVCELLSAPEVDVRRVAAVTLGLVGDRSCVGCLTRALQDEDEQVNQMAEHGLWAIWFRSGDARASLPFREGVAMISTEAYEQAIDRFREAIRIDPDFAEAYNQCGIARFFMGHWRDSIEDCKQTLLRQPGHFGAAAGMGHSYTHLGDLHRALDCYRRAVTINPNMPAIARAIERLECKLEGQPEPAKQQQVHSKSRQRR